MVVGKGEVIGSVKFKYGTPEAGVFHRRRWFAKGCCGGLFGLGGGGGIML